jgi:hypothetical protein
MAPEQPEATWCSLALPMAMRLEVAAAMGLDFVHKPEGARALAILLKAMAARLDHAVTLQLAAPPSGSVIDGD